MTGAEQSLDFSGLDGIFHGKARLAIVTALAGNPDGLSFTQLKSLCGLTDGNLNRHLQVLDEAGYVTIEKGQEGNRPLTRCRLSDQGRTDFCAYLTLLEGIVQRAKSAAWPPAPAAALTG